MDEDKKDINSLILMLGIIGKKMDSVIGLLIEANKNLKSIEEQRSSTSKE